MMWTVTIYDAAGRQLGKATVDKPLQGFTVPITVAGTTCHVVCRDAASHVTMMEDWRSRGVQVGDTLHYGPVTVSVA